MRPPGREQDDRDQGLWHARHAGGCTHPARGIAAGGKRGSGRARITPADSQRRVPVHVKQVILVNESLAMPAGKLAAQVAHASIGAYLQADTTAVKAWLAEGMPKVVLACASADELRRLLRAAEAKRLPADLVVDAGRTVVPAGSVTCLGIGPAPDSAIASLTGALPLLR